jgi:cytochrome bd-type quinol oxidase subunit 1
MIMYFLGVLTGVILTLVVSAYRVWKGGQKPTFRETPTGMRFAGPNSIAHVQENVHAVLVHDNQTKERINAV